MRLSQLGEELDRVEITAPGVVAERGELRGCPYRRLSSVTRWALIKCSGYVVSLDVDEGVSALHLEETEDDAVLAEAETRAEIGRFVRAALAYLEGSQTATDDPFGGASLLLDLGEGEHLRLADLRWQTALRGWLRRRARRLAPW